MAPKMKLLKNVPRKLSMRHDACDQHGRGNIYQYLRDHSNAQISASYPRPLRRPSASAINSHRAVFSACSVQAAFLPTSSTWLTPRSAPQTSEHFVAFSPSNNKRVSTLSFFFF